MENDKKAIENEQTTTPPRGLFSRIIKRLGLEKQLIIVKRYLGFSIAALAVFLVLFTFALLGFRAILDETSFGPFMSLAMSDPGTVLRYWHSFMFSFFELMPGMHAALVLFTVGFIMLLARWIVNYSEKISFMRKSIDNSRFTHNDPK